MFTASIETAMAKAVSERATARWGGRLEDLLRSEGGLDAVMERPPGRAVST